MSTETNAACASAHFVGKREDLVQAKRAVRTLDGREIIIIHHSDTFYALDLHCYHAGSKLEHGDIEEIDRKLCIICPKHKYKISLADGEGLYKAKDPTQKVRTFRWYSKGIRQRVHTVTQVGEDVFVTLSDTSCYIESDYYYTEEGRMDREKAENSTETGITDEDDS